MKLDMLKPYTEEKLCERVKLIFNQSRMSDLTLFIGSGFSQRIFYAHKLILCTASSELGKMLSDEALTEIRFPEYSPDAFKIVLGYLYTDTVTNHPVGTAFDVYDIGDRFCMKQFLLAEEKHIISLITTSTVLEIYVYTHKRNMIRLREHCVDLIESKADTIIRSEDFKTLPFDCIEEIIQSPLLQLGHHGEVKLIEALLLWGESECDRRRKENIECSLRSVLENFLPHLRFLTLTPTEFVTSVLEKEILTMEEGYYLLAKIANPSSTKFTVPFRFSLNTHTRPCLHCPNMYSQDACLSGVKKPKSEKYHLSCVNRRKMYVRKKGIDNCTSVKQEFSFIDTKIVQKSSPLVIASEIGVQFSRISI